MPRWPKKETTVEEGLAEIEKSGGTAVAEAPAPEAPAVLPDEPRAARKDFKPYAGRESLPAYKVLLKGDKGKPDKIELSEPRFACHRGERRTVKVLAYYAHPKGVLRKVWAVIKPIATRPRDMAIYGRLKAARIPGAF